MADYLALDALSSGRLNTLLSQSPYHALHDKGGAPSDRSDMGTAIHDGLLEGIERIVPCAFNDWKTNASKEMRDAARAEGKIPVLEKKLPQIQGAISAARKFIAASELAGVLDEGEAEQTVIWKEGDVLCKARPDWLNREWGDGGVVLHVKTTEGSAQPDSWIRNQLSANGYDVALAFYQRGIEKTLGTDIGPDIHAFLIIEQDAPHGCSLVSLAPAFSELAHAKVARGLKAWQACKATGKFTAYPARIAYADPMPWHVAEEESKGFTAEEMEGGLPL